MTTDVINSPRPLLERVLSAMEGDWYQIDSEWGPTAGGLEAAIVNGQAAEIAELRNLLATAQPAADGERGGAVGKAIYLSVESGRLFKLTLGFRSMEELQAARQEVDCAMGLDPQPAAQPAKAVGVVVPAGYALVPVEPTPGMVLAALSTPTKPDDVPAIPNGWTMNGLAFRTRYRAALAAAPVPPVRGEGGEA